MGQRLRTAYRLLLLALLPSAVCAQDIRYLTSDQGLKQNSIYCVTQDRLGFIWFGTQTGVNRYDGRNVKPYGNNTSNRGFVKSLIYDSLNDCVWGTSGRSFFKIRYDPVNSIFDFDTVKVKVFSATEEAIAIQVLDERTLAVASAQSVAVYSLTSNDIIATWKPGDRSINAIASGPEPGMILAATDRGVTKCYVRGNKIESTDLPGIDESVYSILVDPKQQVVLLGLLGTIANYSLTFETNETAIIRNPYEKLRARPSVISRVGDKYMVGTNLGAYSYRPGEPITSIEERGIGEKDKLSSNLISSIFESSDGVVFVGTDGRGMNILSKDEPSFRHFLSDGSFGRLDVPKNNDTWSIYYEAGKYWFGTDGNGLAVLTPTGNNTSLDFLYSSDPGRAGANTIKTITKFGNDLLLGTLDGLYLFGKNERSISKRVCCEGEMIASVLVKGDQVLVGMQDRVLSLNSSDLSGRRSYESIPGVSAIVQDEVDGLTLIGHTDGIFSIDRAGILSREFSYNARERYVENVLSILPTTRYLYVGTRSGLVSIDRTSRDAKLYTYQDGLPDNVIYGLIQDEMYKTIWISTNNGISRFNPPTRMFLNYRDNGGIQNKEFNTGSYYYCTPDMIMFGGVNGVTGFLPPAIPPANKNQKWVALYEDASEEVYQERIFIPNGNRLTIPLGSETGDAKITIAVLQYDQVQNRTIRLKEFGDEDWTPFESNVIELSKESLDPGDNEFSLEIKNASEWSQPQVMTLVNDIPLVRLRQLPVYGKILLVIFFWIFLGLLSYPLAGFFDQRRKSNALAGLQTSVNEISRTKGEKLIIDTALDNLKTSRFFKIKAVAFLNVDYVRERKVKPIESGFADTDFFDLKKFEVSVDIPENERSGVGMKGVVVKLDGKIVRDNTIEKTTYNGEKIRIAPLVKTVDRETEDTNLKLDADYVIGFIVLRMREDMFDLIWQVYVTVYNFWKTYIRNKLPYFSRNPLAPSSTRHFKEAVLKLYVDNLTQAIVESRKESARTMVEDNFRELEKDRYRDVGIDKYTQAFLWILAKRLETNGSEVTFFDIHNQDDWLKMTPYAIGLNVEKIKTVRNNAHQKKKGFIYKVRESQKPYYTGDVDRDENRYGKINEERSQLCIPLIDEPDVVGISTFYSRQTNFFDEFRLAFIQDHMREFTKRAITRISAARVMELATPFSVFKHYKVGTLEPLLRAIEQHYFTNYVGIWERTYEGDKPTYLLSSASKEIEDDLPNELTLDAPSEVITSDLIGSSGSQFKSFAASRELKTQVCVPLMLGGRHIGVIYVFLKAANPVMVLTDRDLNFLGQLAVKGSIASLNAKLVDFFINITSNMARQSNIDVTLKGITDSALRILNADSVVLFRYENKQFIRVITSSGTFVETTRDLFAQARFDKELLGSLIDQESVTFAGRSQYMEYRTKHKFPEEPNLFWDREHLKSSVVVRLSTNGDKQGLMFFNFRTKVDVNGILDITKSFANLASTALVKTKEIAVIQSETASLRDAKRELEKERIDNLAVIERLKKDYTEVLAAVNKAPFLGIQEAINHDLRNFLYNLSTTLIILRRLVKEADRTELDKRIAEIKETREFINSLLNLFSLERKTLELVDVNMIVQEVVRPYRVMNPGVKFDLQLSDVSSFYGYKAEIAMIVFNLLQNSIKAIGYKENPEALKSEDIITIKPTAGEIIVTTREADAHIILIVRDDGLGVAREDREEIFKYKVSRMKGTGIGLFFIREILRLRYNGLVSVESKLGHGAAFTLKIPINQEIPI